MLTDFLGGDITAKIFGGMLIVIGIGELGIFGKGKKDKNTLRSEEK